MSDASSEGSRSRSPPRRRSRSDSRDRGRGRRGRSASPDDERRRRRSRSDSRDRRQRRRSRSRERERPPRPPPRQQAPPECDSIHTARVLTIKPFGAFVELDGYQTHGLVHISQLAPRRVETVEDVVAVGDVVKVKVIAVEAGDNGRSKVSVSMKQVDQATGEDLGDGGSGGGAGGAGGGGMRKRRNDEEDLTQYSFGAPGAGGKLTALEHDDEPAEPDVPKVKPNYETTGALAKAANTVNGVNMKYGEPPDLAKPTKHWRLYVFKGKEELEPYHVHRQSMYLLGRERRVCDIPLDHPSCSSQHCVLQFRMTTKTETNERGEARQSKLVRPYLIDLGSTNGCYINNARIEAQRYVELYEKDCIRFGYSSREFVLLNADAQ